jgi:hypothetical protein
VEAFLTPSSDKIEGIRVPSPEEGGEVSRIADLTGGGLRGVEVHLKASEAAEAGEAAEKVKVALVMQLIHF